MVEMVCAETRGANLGGRHGGLQQARIKCELQKGETHEKHEARDQAAAHAAARRWLPHPNFFPKPAHHPVDGALCQMVERVAVYKRRELGDEADGDVSHFTAASAANHSLGNSNARLGGKVRRWRVQRAHRREGRVGLRLPKHHLAHHPVEGAMSKAVERATVYGWSAVNYSLGHINARLG